MKTTSKMKTTLRLYIDEGENAHEGVPAVTGTIKDWCESLIFYQ